jgi:hypothetical protein
MTPEDSALVLEHVKSEAPAAAVLLRAGPRFVDGPDGNAVLLLSSPDGKTVAKTPVPRLVAQ